MVGNVTYITRRDNATGQMTPPDGKRKVFLSYRHSDEALLPLCDRLASYILTEHDVAVWYDRQLTAGQEYDREIQEAIKSSDAFVLILSPDILSSKYILEQEIPFAQQNHVAILPVIAGMDVDQIGTIESVVGRLHMPLWFSGRRNTAPDFPKDALEQFRNGLSISIANKDLLSQVQLFYDRGNHKTSLKYLTFEQIFMKAYGCLFGVDAERNHNLGVRLMESILHSYGDDSDFVGLQKDVALELLKYFYRTNEPELFAECMELAIEKGFDNIFSLTFDIFRQQWHLDVLNSHPILGMSLIKRLYLNFFQHPWDGDKMAASLKEAPVISMGADLSHVTAPTVGEIKCGSHRAYFQKYVSPNGNVCLGLDGHHLNDYDVYTSYGDVAFVFLAYDQENDMLVSMHSDFDHYGPESICKLSLYRVDSDGIRSVTLTSDWIKGMRQLPYNPYTFDKP